MAIVAHSFSVAAAAVADAVIMSFMADLLGLMWRHPLLLCVSLVLFTPPFYPVLRFFSPLLISTAVFLVVVVTFGPALERKASREGEGYGNDVDEMGRPRDGRGNPRGFWEDHVKQQRVREERSWLDGMVHSVKVRLHAWLEQKLRNDDVLNRLGNDGPVDLPMEEVAVKEASRSRSSGGSRKSSMEKDVSSRRSRRGEVMEVRSTDTDEYSTSEDEGARSKSRSSRRRRKHRSRSGEVVLEPRNIGRKEAVSSSDNDESDFSARRSRSRSSSRKLRSWRRPGSRSNSRKSMLRYDGDAEELLRGGSSRPVGEATVVGEAIVGAGLRERSRSKSRSNSRPKSSSRSFRRYVEDTTEYDTEEDARLQEEALARHQLSMSRSRANSRSNSGRSFRYEESTNFGNEVDARLRLEAAERSFSRSESGSRSSRRDYHDENKGLEPEEEELLASRTRTASRSSSRRGMMIIPQVPVLDTDSDDEPRLVPIARRPSPRLHSNANSFKVSEVGRSGSDEGAPARVEVDAATSVSPPRNSRSNSGNGRNAALPPTNSETDGQLQLDEVYAAIMSRENSGSSPGSGARIPSPVREDSGGHQTSSMLALTLPPPESAASEAEVEKSRSDRPRSVERIQSGRRVPAEATPQAVVATPAWPHGDDDDETSSEEEAAQQPSASTVLPGRLVRALSRELKAHIDEKLVVQSEEPEKKMERLQTLHHEISGILNNFSIHEEEEKLASVLGGLSAFIQGEGKEVVPRTELLPKRWSSKTYADVDILPQTPSVKRLTDSAKDSQKLEMLKLYGNLLQAERDSLTRQDSASSFA